MTAQSKQWEQSGFVQQDREYYIQHTAPEPHPADCTELRPASISGENLLLQCGGFRPSPFLPFQALGSMLKFQDFSLYHGDPNPYAPQKMSQSMFKSVKLHPESLWLPTASPSPALFAGIYQVYCHHPQTGLVGENNGNSLSAWRGHWENDFLSEGKQTTHSIRSTTDYAKVCFLDSEGKSTTLCLYYMHTTVPQ